MIAIEKLTKLLEKYGIETVTKETMKRTVQYESLK